MSTPLATLEHFSASADVDVEGTAAFVTRDHINGATFMSYAHTNWHGRQVDRHVVQGNIITLQRNECIQHMRGKWLLFIDDDMVWRPDDINRLLLSYDELKAQIEEPVMLGGLCFRRQPPFQPTLYMREKPTSGPYMALEDWEDGHVEVDATGCAFLLIPVEVFEAIAGTPMPSYEERQKKGGVPSFFRWDKNYGEDLTFCMDAKKAGVRIFVDTRIEIGHIAELEITKRNFLMEMEHRTGRDYAEKVMINKRMGLPTMSPKEARDRLGG